MVSHPAQHPPHCCILYCCPWLCYCHCYICTATPFASVLLMVLFSQHCIRTATPSASVFLSPPFLLLKRVLYHPHLFPEVIKLCPSKGLGEDVRHLFSCRSVTILYSSLLDTVSDKVISDINMLWPIMKHWILRELDATLIIAHDPCRLHFPSE